MKIDELLKDAQRARLSPLKARILNYLEGHPDEVFSYRDEGLVKAVGAKPAAVGFTLWALHKDGLIEKQKVAGKVYFGSQQAVGEVRRRLKIKQPRAMLPSAAASDRAQAVR